MPVTRSSTALCLPVLLLAAVALLSGCGSADSRRAAHMARGEQYLAAGDLPRARVEFGNALQIAPNDPEARYMNGQLAERLGDLRGAVGFYQSVIDAHPDHIRSRAALARLYVLGGLPEKAAGLIKSALAAHPDDAELLTMRAAAREQLHDPAGARADAERAVRLAPSSENAVAVLASLYRKDGDKERAIALLESALGHLPAAADLRLILANLYAGNGDPARAEAQLARIVQIRAHDLGARLQLASFYAGNQRLDDAERTLHAAVDALPDSDQAKLAYADFLASRRSPARGQQVLRGYIAKDPRNYDLRLGLGAMQQRAGASEAARSTYRALIAEDLEGPKGVAARDRLAALEAAAGRPDAALTLANAALQFNPRDSDALTVRGNLELDRGDAQAAIADLRSVLRDQPGAVPVVRSLARAHLANGEAALAEEQLRAALQAAPQDAALRLDLAQLLLQTQRAPQAVALLEEGVRSSPQDVPLRQGLVKADLARPDPAAAEAAAADLKTLRPDDAASWYLAGLVEQQRQHVREARAAFEHALQLRPDALDALGALANLELSQGRRDFALTLLRDAVARAPGNAVAHNLLGEAYLAGRNYPQAVAALGEATRLAPRWPLPYRNLALACTQAHDSAGAVRSLENGVRATQDPALVTDLASLYEQQGRVDEAIHQYELLRAHAPHSPVAANNLAMLLVTYRRDQASLDRARELTAGFAASDSPALLDTQAWVLFKRGEVTQALAVLERASAQAPDSRVIRYHLGMAQLRAGQAGKARASLEAALAGGARFTGTDEARSALAQLQSRSG